MEKEKRQSKLLDSLLCNIRRVDGGIRCTDDYNTRSQKTGTEEVSGTSFVGWGETMISEEDSELL